ncbi:phosphotransferase [Shewanella sp. JM162201]|uniref:Phosphotransferase n=1 Tax=Shewanella jiangmenensis TaxID=2837387 RepID=A0ABS5V031_9GAMM|nr:phosphotransferase [Shewanella jiangmenensis]MBT1442939.1 phosphotransferase [Shewanella jiangmenensis]
MKLAKPVLGLDSAPGVQPERVSEPLPQVELEVEPGAQPGVLMDALPKPLRTRLQAPEVTAFLHSHFGEMLINARFEPLTLGLSNDNLIIRIEDDAWVLRINRDASSRFCQRAFEGANWRLAADKALAPPLVAQSVCGRCYLSPLLEQGDWQQRYVELPASAFSFSDLSLNDIQKLQSSYSTSADASSTATTANANTTNTALLLELLTGLASLPLPANVKGFAAQWQDYASALSLAMVTTWQADPELVAAHQALLQSDDDIQRAIAALEAMDLPLQFSHRDLTPHNILRHQGRLFCIDFEYACASHPLWDLAAVLASHQLSMDERMVLALAYLNGHASLNLGHVHLIGDAVRLHWYFGAVWALLMAGESGDNQYLVWFYRYLQLARS